jgi:hypothetical protein
VTLIKKARIERDIRERNVCVAHERHSLTQAAAHPVFPRRASECLSKCSGEIDRMHSELLRHLRDLQSIAASVM